MGRKHIDLLLVGGLALAAVTITLLSVQQPALRILLGLPLAVLLPGYALTAALFPHPSLPGPDRALYTLALSLSGSIISGFALNASPWGLSAEAWAVILAELTLGGCMVAFARRSMPPETGEAPSLNVNAATPSVYGLSLGQGLLFGLALIVVVGAIGLTRAEAQKRPPADVLQLWMLPNPAGEAPGLRLGVNSVGPAEGVFRLQLLREGYLIHEWFPITITPGDRWETQFSLITRQPGHGAFEARLSRLDEPQTVLRKVSAWITQP